MARTFRTTSYTAHEFFSGRHRFEHWYRDNTIYFITARCRDKFPAFAVAKAIELNAFLEDVPYARYDRKRGRGHAR